MSRETFWIPPKAISRRTALKGAGVFLALPFLDAMADKKEMDVPRRMVAICTDQGIIPWYFFPEKAGMDYDETRYLKHLSAHKKDMTVLSGVALPDVDGGHHADIAFLTGAAHPSRAGFKNTVSLDVRAAEHIGVKTRFPTLPLLIGKENKRGLSFTRSGVMIPPEKRASKVFEQLFVQGSEKDIQAQLARLQEGRSILDVLRAKSKRLADKVGKSDKEKIEQYEESVREAEVRLQKMQAWEKKPKPAVSAQKPKDHLENGYLIDRSTTMFHMAKLALETDSTRLITIFIEGDYNPKIKLPDTEVSMGWHELTHHGKRKEKLEQLSAIEDAQFKVFNKFLNDLKSVKEDTATLFDRTSVLYGTNMGDANRHSNDNLPFLIAGGGFKHKGHLAFSKKNNYPLSNLYVSVLQRLGIETDSFSSSTGAMTGLDLA
ncbi:MAG: DUF1552 domain-containing protein [Lentisphaeraceae bacterium]|nr:DUF1552 domain-containing protein [Lentisphaeraceae bacterium]